ncbi:MAG: LytR C-terminal domain-containing protein [Patescibacteria group bacterium]
MAETTKNFIYLLPDVAYIVELVKTKDDESFKIRDYLQVNGSFMDENEILDESIKKLANRLQSKTYELVLPDFLFTNTVVNVEEAGEEKILEYVKSKIIPDLDISDETHELHTFVLTEFKGQAKVQLSALEKTVLKPLRTIFTQSEDLKVDKIYPLSWVTKSLISLEPSISVVQLGANLYMAQHYIGIDQANNAEVEDVEKIIESIKTLKGAEPSIQTVYLLANALVEDKLNNGLKGTLPVQQLAKESEDSEMPSYVKQVIEAGIKSVGIADYKVPSFSFLVTTDSAVVVDKDQPEDSVVIEKKAVKLESPLPPPTELGTSVEESQEQVKVSKDDEEKVADEPEKQVEESIEDKAESKVEEVEEQPVETTTKEKTVEKEDRLEEKTDSSVEQVDLRQFMSEDSEDKETKTPSPEKTEAKPEETPMAKKVIKNDTGVNSMVKMVFVALVSFFITVGIGLGIGLGFLTFTNKQQTANESMVTPVAELSPTLEPTTTPTLEPIDRASYTVLVVNATTKAGYAGEIATVLEKAGFTDVQAANAKGDYETGNFILAKEDNNNLIKTLEEDMALTLEFSEEKELEDATDKYDFVIVLAE